MRMKRSINQDSSVPRPSGFLLANGRETSGLNHPFPGSELEGQQTSVSTEPVYA